MSQKFNDDRLRFLVGDVRDKERMTTALHDIDYVIYMAALKQVPSCEYNPFEAIKTNIIGSQKVIEASIENKVKVLIGVSTDKAVSPLNLYGATKMCLERLMIAVNVYNRKLGDTRISCVRYGNVIGSRGSVIELWEKQLKEGKPLTLTDERMTRFWMPIETAVQLIMTAIKEGKGGEIFIPKAPKKKMYDVAHNIIGKSLFKDGDLYCESWIKDNIKIIGLRESEKLHETLINEHEANRTLEFKDSWSFSDSLRPIIFILSFIQ